MTLKRSVLTILLMEAVTPAWAHTGSHAFSGFTDGFLHPFGGADHALAMLSVGLFATLLGGRALWALPASFIAMMLVGGMLGLSGIELPAVEAGIVASVVILGALVGLGRRWPVHAAMALVGAFAIFHGFAHGAEIPAGADAGLYSLGFMLASLLLHAVGLFGGLSLGRTTAMRYVGAAVAVTGAFIALG